MYRQGDQIALYHIGNFEAILNSILLMQCKDSLLMPITEVTTTNDTGAVETNNNNVETPSAKLIDSLTLQSMVKTKCPRIPAQLKETLCKRALNFGLCK